MWPLESSLVGLVEQRTWITEAMANPPVTFQVTGTWQGAHPHWSDAVIINADGTYHRGNGDPGRWTFDGRTLVLNWTNWAPSPWSCSPTGASRRQGAASPSAAEGGWRSDAADPRPHPHALAGGVGGLGNAAVSCLAPGGTSCSS